VITTLLFLIDVDPAFETAELLNVLVAAVAMAMLVLTVSAYRRTRLRRLLFVSVAFGLFAVEVLVRQVDDFVITVSAQTEQIATTGIELGILVLFFIAVVLKNDSR
jgi:hypothetical protein